MAPVHVLKLNSNRSLMPKSPPPSYRNIITMLSIDDDSVCSIIPGTILTFLKEKLQELDGPDARISTFDVIAGTSIGGLVTTMLTAPNAEGHPLFTAKNINNL